MATKKVLFDHFVPEKFLGNGSFSTVYQVRLAKGENRSTSYALKQFTIRNLKAVDCALREQRILKRLALHKLQSRFIANLHCSFFDRGSAVLVLTRGSELSLSHLLDYCFPLDVNDTKFYGSEIICGLEYLHNLGVVHLDMKPSNILLSDSGHVLISDFDCSYDMTIRMGPPLSTDYKGNRTFMAPEVARKNSISCKADVWSFGALISRMTIGYVRFDKESVDGKFGKWNVEGFVNLPKSLQSLLKACLRLKPRRRPNIRRLTYFPFFKGINWSYVKSQSYPPPLEPSKLSLNIPKERAYNLNYKLESIPENVDEIFMNYDFIHDKFAKKIM